MDNYCATFTSSHDTVQLDASNKGKKKVSGVVADYAPLKDHVVWTPPPNDHIKINVGASFVESSNAVSVGVVAVILLEILLFLRGTLLIGVPV